MSQINSSFPKRWGEKRSNKDNGESVNCDAHSSGISFSLKKKKDSWLWKFWISNPKMLQGNVYFRLKACIPVSLQILTV